MRYSKKKKKSQIWRDNWWGGPGRMDGSFFCQANGSNQPDHVHVAVGVTEGWMWNDWWVFTFPQEMKLAQHKRWSMYILKECTHKQTPTHMLLGFLQRKLIKSNAYQALGYGNSWPLLRKLKFKLRKIRQAWGKRAGIKGRHLQWGEKIRQALSMSGDEGQQDDFGLRHQPRGGGV
jgi:hypothetical protein